MKPSIRLVAIVLLVAWGCLLGAESQDIPLEEDPPRPVADWQVDLKALAAKNPKAETYRLTVQRSFDPDLVFEMESEAIFLQKTRRSTGVMSDSMVTTYRVVRDSRLPIEPEEFKAFRTLLRASSFWNLPTEDWQSLGLDGSSWVLEGVKDGKYHRVERSNPFIHGTGTPLDGDLKKLPPDRIYSEGRLIAAFMYLWALSGEANEKLY